MASRSEGSWARAALLSLVALLAPGCLSARAGYREARALSDKRLHIDLPSFDTGDGSDASIASLLDAPLTAQSAVQIAAARSRRVRAAFDRVGVARADLVAAIQLPNPNVDGNTRFRVDRTGAGPDVDLGLSVDVRQLILLPLRHRSASYDLDAAAIEATADVMELALETRLAYVDHVAATQAFELESQITKSFEASAELAEAIAAAGNEYGVRALSERAMYEEAKLRYETAKLQVGLTRARLNELMGITGEEADQWKGADRLADPLEADLGVDAAIDAALDTSLELAMASARVAALDGASTIARVEGVLPQIQVGAVAERDQEGWSVGPQVSVGIPIFNQNAGDVGRFTSLGRQEQHLSEALAIGIRTRATTLVRTLENLRLRVDAYTAKILPARAMLVEQTQRLYNAMGTSAFDLFQARRDQVVAARDYVDTLRSYWRVRAELDTLLSGHLAEAGHEGS